MEGMEKAGQVITLRVLGDIEFFPGVHGLHGKLFKMREEIICWHVLFMKESIIITNHDAAKGWEKS